MRGDIDYLKLERKTHNEGSYNANVQELVKACRFIREGIPGTDIPKYMPAVYELERKLHKLDAQIGEPPRPYVQEIMEVLENEPEEDFSKSFNVCTMEVNESGEVSLTDTYLNFPQHVLAEEWIKEEADKTHKYVILEVIDPSLA